MTELEEKMGKVGSINAAIDRVMEKSKLTYDDAVSIQRLKRQRQQLMGTMPRVRLVWDKDQCKKQQTPKLLPFFGRSSPSHASSR